MDHVEKRILEIIEENRDRIIEFGRDIFHHAELGYKEFHTSEKFKEALNGHVKKKKIIWPLPV